MHKFIFDVDGTLTPSRQKIDPQFEAWFSNFINTEKVWLVTGSDYKKTVEQLGSEICESVVTVYNCSGNDVWFKGKRVNSKPFTPPKELYDLMNGWLQTSSFPLRTGNHIEERTGTINFSIVGRNCTLGERKLYIKHDLENRERESIAFQINLEFPDITAVVGGETGIDIFRKGGDKSQILEDFDSTDHIYFFGDRMSEDGNDYPLARKLDKKKCFAVRDWKHTFTILKNYLDNDKQMLYTGQNGD
jgi:phosphomannomutase